MDKLKNLTVMVDKISSTNLLCKYFHTIQVKFKNYMNIQNK